MNTFVIDFKRTLHLALPISTMLVAQKALQLINALMMGLLGAVYLAAGALSTSIYTAFLIIGIGILNTVGILIAHSYGANSKEGVTTNLHHGLYVSFILSFSCMVAVWHAPALLSLIHQNPQVVELTKQFLHAVLWGYPALLGFATLREFVSALNYPRIVMIVSCGAIPLNVVLSYILMYGKFGFPLLGIAGIGYGNAITEWAIFFALLSFIAKNSYLSTYASFLKPSPIKWQTLGEIFRIGVPGSITSFLETVMSASLVMLMGYFGVVALAAHQIAFQCATFVYMVPLGISLAMGLRVGHMVGEQHISRALRTIYIGLGIGMCFSIIVILIFVLFPGVLVNLFIHPNETNYREVSHLAILYLTIAALFQCFDTLQVILIGCLRGLKDTFIPMLIAIFSYLFIALGGGYLLAFKLQLRGVGLWWGLALGLGFSSMLLLWRLHKKIKKLDKLIRF
jgi:MATE family multidrug resistance protein